MLKRLSVIVFVLITLFVTASQAFAQTNQPDPQEYFAKGRVIVASVQKKATVEGMTVISQQFKVLLLDGKEQGKTVTVTIEVDPKVPGQIPNQGDMVVIDSKLSPQGDRQYSLYEPYRLQVLLVVAIIFGLFVIFIGGFRGIGALVGLGVSIVVISSFIVPQIISGHDPLQTTIFGACAILIATTYIAHGVSLKTTTAIIGTAISFFFAGWLATTLVSILNINGLGSEDIYNLQVGNPTPINPQGLLLSGILIGTLGALNDITTTQAVTMFTLVKENPKQHMIDLYTKGMTIGREHIASLINTLVLAYAGSSLAVLIYFELNPAKLPWWVILNNETTIEEILKSLVGSIAIILAVPLTTLLAAWVAKKRV